PWSVRRAARGSARSGSGRTTISAARACSGSISFPTCWGACSGWWPRASILTDSIIGKAMSRSACCPMSMVPAGTISLWRSASDTRISTLTPGASMPPRNVHLVGSVPLGNAHDVFVALSTALGPRLRRIPDGETGERSDWIAHLEPIFAEHPALEKSDEVFRLHASAPGRTRYRLRPGVKAKDVTFGNRFYADTALRSYEVFARLRERGVIPPHCRFQVDLVPAHSVIWLFLQDDLHRELDPIYNDGVRREIDKLARAIPHDQLAIQFDVASA